MYFRFLTVPTWMRVLIVPAFFFRFLLFYRVLARVAGKSATGRLPVTATWWWTFMTIRWGSRGMFLAGIALMARALVVSNGPAPESLLGLALLALFVSALLAWVAWPAVRPRARVRRVGDDSWIELSGVHPRFAMAVREGYSGGGQVFSRTGPGAPG